MGRRVRAIIVTYNSAGYIADCLDSLLDGTEGISITVIDNKSVDDTATIVAGYASVEFRQNQTNVGFSKAVNQCLSDALADEYILLLNPDATLSGRDLAAMVGELAASPSVGVVAPLVHQNEGRMQVVQGGCFPTLWRMFTHQSGLSRLGSVVPSLQGHYFLIKDMRKPRLVDVEWVSGGCMLIAPHTRAIVPFLDETWFMYAEDIEYCLRVKRAGLRVCILPTVAASHAVGGSHDSSKRPSSAWLVNLFDLYRRDISTGAKSEFLWKFVVSIGLLSRAVAYSARAMKSRANGAERAHWKRNAYAFAVYAHDLVRTK